MLPTIRAILGPSGARRGRSVVAALATAAILPFTLPACSRQPQQAAAPESPPEQVYTLRGRITSLPVQGQPLTNLSIMHEALPSFVNKDGKVVGMPVMDMPFSPAPGVSLEGLSVGDPVEFTFEMRWHGQPRSQLTRIAKLPPDTALDLPPKPE
jgi:hypothetical protein